MYINKHFSSTIAFITCLVTFSPAEEFLDNFKGIWGVGGNVLQSNYRNANTETTLAPYIFGSFGPLRIEANRVLYSLYNTHTYSILATGNYRSQQYSKELDKDRSIELGLTLDISLSHGFNSRFTILGDVSDTHNGYEIETLIYRHDTISKISILTSLAIQYQDKDLANYYYATNNYVADDGYVFEAEVIATYPIGDFSIFAGVRSYWYGSNVSDSPLSNASNTLLSFFGVGYNF
jgi:outer membrane scaffolding protein for murein synthesis (MipA/OmpV family)